jgi:hypothetical protein
MIEPLARQWERRKIEKQLGKIMAKRHLSCMWKEIYEILSVPGRNVLGQILIRQLALKAKSPSPHGMLGCETPQSGLSVF